MEFDEPFPGSWAVQAGLLTRWQLSKDFDRVHPDVYTRAGTALDAQGRALAAGHWAKGAATLVGYSAVALHGVAWFQQQPAELAGATVSRAPRGIVAHRYELADDEVETVAGFLVTTPARTAFDLGRRLPFEEAVVVIDALSQATGLAVADIVQVVERHPGARGVTDLRKALEHIDGGAESPQESRTRLLLIQDGLPRPETQITVRGPDGMVIARADLGWREWQVAVEYDGEQHWSDRRQRSWDIDRLEFLHALGWAVIRVSAELLHDRPWVILERVRLALRAAGANLVTVH